MTLEPTLAMAEAARRTWGALVVGAGPAGALAARELARRGVEVLLVDKASFPRWKVCGCCLNARAQAALEKSGLGDLTKRCGAVALNGLLLAVNGRRATLRLQGSVALSREVLDAALIRSAVAAGAAFLPETRAAGGADAADARPLRLQRGAERVDLKAQVTLAADGLSGTLAGAEPDCGLAIRPDSRIGAGAYLGDAPACYRAGTIHMACGRGGYVGLVRLEDGRLNVGAAFDPALVKEAGGLGEAAARILGEAGLPAGDALRRAVWRGTPPLTRRLRRPAAHRLLALGDAARYEEPFTGEGMAWALTQGLAVAPLAARGVDRWDDNLENEWCSLQRRLAAFHAGACFALAWVLRRPRAAGALGRLLASFPALARPAVRYFTMPLAAEKAVRP